MESKSTAQTNYRRPPLHTCGVSFIKITNKVYKGVQDFNGPLSSITKKIIRLASVAAPLVHALKFQLLLIFSFFDKWIFRLEYALETIYPPSRFALDKFDQLVGFAEILPEKFDEAVNKFLLIIHQVVLSHSCKYFFLSRPAERGLENHLVARQESLSIKENFVPNNPIFSPTKPECKNDHVVCQESPITKEDFVFVISHCLSPQRELENDPISNQETPSIKEDFILDNLVCSLAEQESKNDNVASQEPSITKEDFFSDIPMCLLAQRELGNDLITHQETPKAKEDFVPDNPIFSLTERESKDDHVTCQESPITKKNYVVPGNPVCLLTQQESGNDLIDYQEISSIKEEFIPKNPEFSLTCRNDHVTYQGSLITKKSFGPYVPVCLPTQRELDNDLIAYQKAPSMKENFVPNVPIFLPIGKTYKDVLEKGNGGKQEREAN